MIMILNHNIFHKIQSAHQDAGRCSLYQTQTHPHDPVIPFADFLKQCPRLPNHLHNPHNQDDPLNHQNPPYRRNPSHPIHPSLKAHALHPPLHQHVLAIIIGREKMLKRFPLLLIKESPLWDL